MSDTNGSLGADLLANFNTWSSSRLNVDDVTFGKPKQMGNSGGGGGQGGTDGGGGGGGGGGGFGGGGGSGGGGSKIWGSGGRSYGIPVGVMNTRNIDNSIDFQFLQNDILMSRTWDAF
ncbi:hypothetical protein MAR_017682 [Mya arenaria]|uniref:Uncharacterized protein n=1 Tax=Mya arenaria TaxID=6604 RepID=A0ABY7EF00_MYAAR|nr:hypothetical protein MAR_017682 [Mya arenaria]